MQNICSDGENKERTMIKCAECKGRIHVSCSRLPLYQVGIYIKTQRKYTCEICADVYFDDAINEVIGMAQKEHQITEQTTRAENAQALQNVLQAQHQNVTDNLQNLEIAVTSLA